MNGSKRDKIPIPYPWSIILKIDYKITIVIYSSEPNQRKISTKSPTRRSFQTKFKVIQNEEPGQRFKSSTSKGNINSPDLTNPLPMHQNSESCNAVSIRVKTQNVYSLYRSRREDPRTAHAAHFVLCYANNVDEGSNMWLTTIPSLSRRPPG